MRKAGAQQDLEICSRTQSSRDLALDHYVILPLFKKQMLPKRDINDTNLIPSFLQHRASPEEVGEWKVGLGIPVGHVTRTAFSG